MWADFAASVDCFLEFLRAADDRRRVVLERALRSHIAVEVVNLTGIGAPASGWAGPFSDSAVTTTTTTSGASAIAWVPPPTTDKD